MILLLLFAFGERASVSPFNV